MFDHVSATTSHLTLVSSPTPTDEATDTLLASDAWTRGGVRFPAPRSVIEPILEQFQKAGLSIEVAGRYQQARTVVDKETGDDHTAYGRWCVEYRSHSSGDGLAVLDTIGVMVATDLAAPKIQVYRGPVVASCLNLSIWNADDLRKLSAFGDGFAAVGEIVSEWITVLEDEARKQRQMLEAVERTHWPRAEFDKLLGGLYRDAVLKRVLDLSVLGKAVEYLFGDVPTPYSIMNGEVGAGRFFGALSDVLSNGDKMPLNQRAPKIQAVCKLVQSLPGIHLN